MTAVIIQWAEDEVSSASAWALSYLKSGLLWSENEASIFGHAVVTEIKLEVPIVEHAVVSALEDLVGQIVTNCEQIYATGDLKFSNAVSQMIAVIENDGVAGVKLILSTTLKEALIQAGAAALKAGLLAVA